MSPLKRGALIVIEGVDRSGKSTQCRNLVHSLEVLNIPTKLMNFPDRTTLTGQLISKYLSEKNCDLHDKAIHLLFSANRWENVSKMRDLLYKGYTLVIDRYSYSGIAFSSIKKNMDIEWCKHPEIGLPKPDLVFLFALPEEEIQKRPGFGDERYENIEIQRRVADAFHRMAQSESNWKVVDASGAIEDIQKLVLNDVLLKISEVRHKPLETLEFSSLNNCVKKETSL